MSIVRYSPNEFVPASFSSIVDRFFNDSIARSGGSTFIPKVDVIENADSFEIHFAAPGLSKEDFKIELNDNVLKVSGERKFSNEKKEKNYHSIETQYGSFSRSFNLPDNVDGAKINARYTNGILELTIPKDEKKVLKQTIKVD
ncbi:MAG: heat-shock protein Hsp20 [Azospira oryzae]|jgi:HSP20 family protein|nr:MAG: heat-shock protein Hsp20 [Azospira oryzae]